LGENAAERGAILRLLAERKNRNIFPAQGNCRNRCWLSHGLSSSPMVIFGCGFAWSHLRNLFERLAG
jgi:hypothetical protein